MALFVLAFTEAIFFPVPPDVLLIVLALSRPERSLYYAIVCTGGSVLGGMLGFVIGLKFWEIARVYIFRFITPESFEVAREYFLRYDAWAVAIAGFTPVPYKVFTISAGFFRIDFLVFVVASVLSRGARFLLVAGLFYFFGNRAKVFVQRYFNIITVAVVILLIFGFLIFKGLN